MGLYDKPLPPRGVTTPRNDDDGKNNNSGDDKDDDDDDDNDNDKPYQVQQTIFEFNMDGTEVRGFLPRLSRTLESGMDCYFEETDRLVLNLVDKTECHPQDAAWALEACQGDMTEAWTCISTARRQILIGGDNVGLLSSEVSQLMAENDFEILKEERLKRERMIQRRDDAFIKGVPDADWLPTKNPKPIDEEPWFTG